MRQLTKKGIAFLLAAVMVLSLCPLPGVWAAGSASGSGQVLETSGWSDAGWGGLPAAVSSGSDSILKIALTDETESGWRATAVQKENLSGISGVKKVTLQYSGGDASALSFSVQVAGNDSSGTWRQYSADGVYDSGTVTFSVFKADGASEAADLSTYPPTRLTIQIGSNSTLPGEMTLTNITVVSPDDSSQVLESSGWRDANWGGLSPEISSEASSGLEITVTDNTTGDGWRATAIKKEDLSGISGVKEVTLQYSGGDASALSFSAQLAGNDSSSTWRQYSADGVYDSGTVTFSVFKADGASEAADLSAFAPTRLVIQIGSNSTLPEKMTLTDITIVPPTGSEDDGTVIKNDEWVNEGYTSVVTQGGYFRVEFDYTTKPDTVTLCFQGDSVDWTAMSPSQLPDGTSRQGDIGGETNKYYAEFTYNDYIKALGTADPGAVRKFVVQWNNKGIIDNECGVTSVTIKYYPTDPNAEEPDAGKLTKDDQGVVTIPEYEQYQKESGLDFAGWIASGGYFRVEYTLKDGLDDKGVQLVIEPGFCNVSDVSKDKNGNDRRGNVSGNTYYAEFSYADCIKVWDATHEGQALDQMTKVYPQYKDGSWHGPDGTDFKAAVESYSVKYYPTDPNAEEPGPGLIVDENKVVTVPVFEQQQDLDFTGLITPGGYFRMEYTLKDGAQDAGIQLTMQPAWCAVGSASIDKNGNARKGLVSGNTYYAEFTYADCETAWHADGKNQGKALDQMEQVFFQHGWKGPSDPAFKDSIASYTIKYYPKDTKVAYSLDANLAVMGTTSLSPVGVTGEAYQWYRVVGNATADGTAIDGATHSTYIPKEAEKGCWVYCVIDGGTADEIVAGPAAVVKSTTLKTTVIYEGSAELGTGDDKSKTLWPLDDAATDFFKTMVVPTGYFRLTCEPAGTNINLIPQNAWEWDSQHSGAPEDGYVDFSYDTVLAAWKKNFNMMNHLTVSNEGSDPVTITKLEWIGPDLGAEEAPYMPTDELPFGGSKWVEDWAVTKSVTQNEANSLLTAAVKFDGGEWSKARMKTHSDNGFKVDGKDMLSMNVYLEKAAMEAGKGQMLLQLLSQENGGDKELTGEFALNTSGDENVVQVNGTDYYRTALNIRVEAGKFPERFHDFILSIRGKNSSYEGKILVENMIHRKAPAASETPVDVVTTPMDFTDTAVTVTPSSSTSAFYSDQIKVSLSAATAPTEPITVQVILNGKKETVREITVPASRFTSGADGKYTADIEGLEVLATVGPITSVKVVTKPAVSGLRLTGLQVINSKPKEAPAVSDGGGGGGGSNLGGGGGGSGLITLPYTWKFDSQIVNPWKYEPGWNSNYSGKSSTEAKYRNGRLALYVNYSKDGDQGWSQMAVTLWHDRGMALKNATHVYLDLYYLPEKLDGSLTMKLYSGGAKIDAVGTVDWGGAKDAKIDGQMYKKVRVDFTFPPVTAITVHDMALCLIGQHTTYRGPILIENMTIEEAYAGSFVWSRHIVKKENSTLRLRGSELTTASGETVTLPSQVTLADGQASAAVRSVYAYLQAMGKSRDVLFGQQYNFGQKAGSSNLSDSDTYDITGDYSAVFGLDGLALAGAEFSAGRCSELYGTPFPSTAEGNVTAAAYLTNTAIKRGAIVTLSCHMPNFSQVKTVTPNCAARYAKYNFAEYTPNVLTGDTANEILPGGKYHEVFTAYLDMIADYANQVNGAVLFRPFHENTGTWFWWGADSCEAETYKNIYRYTVEYLRDERNVHNFLYVYGPGSEAKTLEDYAARYPGDSYVDLVGFDMYNWDPDENSGWMEDFRKELELVSQFARQHNKLAAVTETGAANDTVAGDQQTALLRTGNKDKDWFNRVLEVVSDSPASYLLVWANFGQNNGFYTPYVIRTEGRELFGHEMMDEFIDYYNDPRSVFAGDQRAVLQGLPRVTAKAAAAGPEGYITAPISGRQVRAGMEFTARVARAGGAKVQFVLHGKSGSVTLDARSTGGVTYRAQVSQADLDRMGDPTDGKAELLVNGTVQQTIRLNSSNPFLDVASGAYYAPAVQWALAQGITGGTTASTFSPNRPCTRAQVVTFLWRDAGSPEPSSQDNPFKDVPEDAYYYQAILWAVEQGITAGTTKTAFSPNATVTRGQTAAFLYRSAGSPAAGKGASFADVASDAYYAPAVRWALDKGVTGGTTASTFSPNSPCTRAQIVTFLYRAQ